MPVTISIERLGPVGTLTKRDPAHSFGTFQPGGTMDLWVLVPGDTPILQVPQLLVMR